MKLMSTRTMVKAKKRIAAHRKHRNDRNQR